MIKIKNYSTDNEFLEFTNGSRITFEHCQDCCEWNYADFDQIDDIAKSFEFDESNMRFEKVGESGFRFGNPHNMVFVPCYSSQNGYYSADLDIYYNNKKVVSFDDLAII